MAKISLMLVNYISYVGRNNEMIDVNRIVCDLNEYSWSSAHVTVVVFGFPTKSSYIYIVKIVKHFFQMVQLKIQLFPVLFQNPISLSAWLVKKLEPSSRFLSILTIWHWSEHISGVELHCFVYLFYNIRKR